MNATEINELSKRIYGQNKAVGWWDRPRSFTECMSLVNSENGEAVDGARTGEMDKHLKDITNEEVETADQIIRVLDLGGAFGLNYSGVFRGGDAFNNDIKFKDLNPIELQFEIAKRIIILEDSQTNYNYSDLINGIILVVRARGWLDFLATIERKIEYNKTRADHKRENRAKPGGKKA